MRLYPLLSTSSGRDGQEQVHSPECQFAMHMSMVKWKRRVKIVQTSSTQE